MSETNDKPSPAWVKARYLNLLLRRAFEQLQCEGQFDAELACTCAETALSLSPEPSRQDLAEMNLAPALPSAGELEAALSLFDGWLEQQRSEIRHRLRGRPIERRLLSTSGPLQFSLD